jgi:pimeloyl-ACP methyl ester carboxylesterase
MTWLEASAPGGSAIPVVRQGAGRPIVIVHGGSGDLTSWAAVAGRLLDQFSVYRYTRPTYRLGPTPRGAEAMATETAAAQISDNEAIESLGVGLDRYAKLAVPALLLGGAKSQSHFRDRLTALASALPAVDSVVYMPGQSHGANLRGPDQVARVVADFAGSLPNAQ